MNFELSDADCPYNGLLVDEEIRTAIKKGILLTAETSDLDRVRQTSYELRLSTKVEYLEIDESSGEVNAKYVRPANGIENILKIEPGQTLKVLTMESFFLPANVTARITPVGNVYKLGLSPETTYADPGFSGEFYLVLCNYSSRVVELRVGQPIARIEFTKLPKSTRKPHPGAQKVGEPQLWPKRIERRDSDALRQLGLEVLLKELDEKDPPHVEHAFIAREVHNQLNQQLEALSAELNSARRFNATVLLGLYISLVIAVCYFVGFIWDKLPSKIQESFAEGVAISMCGILGGIILFAFPRLRSVINLAINGTTSIKKG
jgi:deoxycytidine triphosphate deaminase